MLERDAKLYSVQNLDMYGDLEDFCTGVIMVLRQWVALHSDPLTWANDWFSGYRTYTDAFERGGDVLLKTPGGEFCLTKADWHRMAMEHEQDWTMYHCSECGCYFDAEYTGYCDCDNPDEDTWREVEGEERTQYLVDACITPSEYALRQAAISDVFALYFSAFDDTIGDRVADIQAVIDDYDAASTNLERLNAALEGLTCEHVHGLVVTDHGSLVGYDRDEEIVTATVADDGILEWEEFTDDGYIYEWLRETDDHATVMGALEGWGYEPTLYDPTPLQEFVEAL